MSDSNYDICMRAMFCMIHAAESLTTPTSDNKAAAILWCARAILHIADSDPGGRARDKAIDVIQRVAAEKFE